MNFENERALVTLTDQPRGRIAPFSGLSVAATSLGGADVLARVQVGQAWLVKRLVVVNRGVMSVSLSMSAVPDGVAANDSHLQLSAFAIPSNTAVDLTDLIGGYYAEGTELRVWAGTANQLTVSGHYEAVF